MVIQHNLTAQYADRNLGLTADMQAKATEKLSSGYRINRAADDAAGLCISEEMRAQIHGLNKASTNAQDGISAIQTAEGALNEMHSILQRMNELATQAANDTNTSADRGAIKKEIDELGKEIDRISTTTQFNTMNLLDGSFTGKNLQVGALEGQKMDLNIKAMDAHALGLTYRMDNSEEENKVRTALSKTPSIENIEKTNETYNAYGDISKIDSTDKKAMFSDVGDANRKKMLMVDTFEHAGMTMSLVQNAVDIVSEQRSQLGAVQQRLEHTIKNLDTTAENVTASESRIRDTDMADEMVEYSKNNILMQAGQSVLSQANQSTQAVLSLLG